MSYIYVFTHLQDGKVTKNMCFYIEKKFQSNPPEPLDPEIHAGLRLDKGGGEVQVAVGGQTSGG